MYEGDMEAGRWMDLAIDNRLSTLIMYHDVVTDWSSALAGILVPMLFGVSPGQS